jgi:hypothetical protein
VAYADEEGYNELMSDPEIAAIFQEAGLEGRPESAELIPERDA